MHEAAVVALAYRYPAPGSLERLRDAVSTLPKEAPRRHMERFLEAVGELELGEWEELHTATLDLSPQVITYVGHVTYGENYRRGEFMADLKVDMEANGVELFGELPDHIEPILRYLAAVDEPLSDLDDILATSVAEMTRTLTAADPDNPYRHALEATMAVVEDPTPIAIGGRR